MKLKPFALERWFGLYEFSTEHNLADSAIQPLTTDELARVADLDIEHLFAKVDLGYRESLGTASLRQAIANLYEGATIDNVLVTIGASEANYLALTQLISAGDRVVVQYPAYQQLYEIPQALGAEVELWHNMPNATPQELLDDLSQLLAKQTDLVILTNPHNPTGRNYDENHLAEICRLAKQAGARLFVDEVYQGLYSSNQNAPVSVRLLSKEAIVIGSTSKAYGLAGLRIGWIVGDSNLINSCWEQRDYVSICPPALSERLAEIALHNRRRIEERNTCIIDTNTQMIEQFMDRHQDVFMWHPPQAGVIAFPQLLVGEARQFCQRAVDEANVLLIPGDVFGCPANIRLGLGIATERLARGLERLDSWLR